VAHLIRVGREIDLGELNGIFAPAKILKEI
jgi:hypothetical protein